MLYFEARTGIDAGSDGDSADAGNDAKTRLVPFEVTLLAGIVSAFAMTVHKAQGSEFDEVLVLLPAQRSRVLTRELLYTAVTRARHGVTLCAGAAVLAGTIETSTRRHSGLLARLQDLTNKTPG